MEENRRYSIGIDLGTTNCALSYVDLEDPDAGSKVLTIPQRSDLSTAVEASTLPSFLYLPSASEKGQLGESGLGLAEGWLVGLAARQRALSKPDRVAHSAKSWLCHHTVSPDSKILPWKSESIADGEKLSPLEVTTRLLAYLKKVWDEAHADSPLERQQVTITVPASFDVAAQRATLRAAGLAGYPSGTRLLEEPQAAFYRWLETKGREDLLHKGQRILVLDIGGGTSDFSLFEVGESADGDMPEIERVAVSDHILLGGDNIDLALAHALESELVDGEEELSPDQWGHLIARARELKERCLADGGRQGESLSVSIPSRGSGLFAGTLSAEISSDDVRDMLLEGFFPECPASARPDRQSGGLLEWGLPYAPDCAVTRYLADFLGQCGGRVDAVLFNGGTMASNRIQKRIRDQISSWQAGVAPQVLENEETDLAVARGAADYGALAYRAATRISAGLGRAVYLEVAAEDGVTRLLCVLPRGAQPESVSELNSAGLQLATGRRVRFAAWQGDALGTDKAGDLRDLDTQNLLRLPPLETEISLEDPNIESVAVTLRSVVNEIGVLQVECLSAEREIAGRWELEFNLRGESAVVVESIEESIDEMRVDRAIKDMKPQLFAKGAKASRILKHLEEDLGDRRSEWPLPVLRRLGDAILTWKSVADRSAEQAEAWLQLTGFCLRPGFGFPSDAARIDSLWTGWRTDAKPVARVAVQEAILWRRVAGGLDAGQQKTLLEREWSLARTKKGATAERIRLLGALEKIENGLKAGLADWCLEEGLTAAKSDGYAAPYFAGLGQILSRTPFQAGPECVLPPERVVAVFERLRKLDWREAEYAEVATLFQRAARVVDDRALDLPDRIRRKIAAKLEKSGVPANKLSPLLNYQSMTRAERASLYGEALPAGLRLG